MKLKDSVNEARRVVMHGITNKLGSSKSNINKGGKTNADINNVLICRPNNRLGNQLLITPLVQEVSETFPNCNIHLFVRGGLAPILFENYDNVTRIINLPKKPFKELFKYLNIWISLKKFRYDIAINVDKKSSSGKLSTQFANAEFKFFNEPDEALETKYKDSVHIAKFAIYNLRKSLSQLGFTPNSKPIPYLDLKLSTKELNNGKEILDQIINNEKKTICLYTFATGGKCYSESWWLDVYEKIKAKFEDDYNIIEVLPIENVSQIAFKAPAFYSKDIREIGALIANTSVFIGADSGITHLASAVNTPVVALFSVTETEVYKPYNKGSISIDTNTTSADELVSAIDKVLIK